MVGLSDSVELSFMVVGHTKFSPDSCFGLLKQQFRRTAVNTLHDIANVVRRSAECNKVEVIGWEDGVPLIPTYDWSTFFAEHMNRVMGIKRFQHFTFKSSQKGKVLCQEECDGAAVNIDLLKDPTWTPSASHLPEVVEPRGLDAKRQWYLYEKIRPFCQEGKDVTCPLPLCTKPIGSTRNSPAPPSPGISSSSFPPSLVSSDPHHSLDNEPPSKKPRLCGACGQQGHNSRTCKQK